MDSSKFIVEDVGSSDERSGGSDELPEIEARVSNNNMLIRVQCKKQKGILANILSQIENLNLAVVNTNVTPFGTMSLDITIIAEMGQDFKSSVKEVLTALRAALRSSA